MGSVSAIEQRVAKALKQPYTEAWSNARGSPVIHADETPWYEDSASCLAMGDESNLSLAMPEEVRESHVLVNGVRTVGDYDLSF